MTVGEKLCQLMRPYKQNQIAKASEISTQSLRNIMDGTTKSPSLETLRRIASALGVSVGWLSDDSAGWPPQRVRPCTDEVAA
jgi:transcriptional regulator with XRE-family HTH domain